MRDENVIQSLLHWFFVRGPTLVQQFVEPIALPTSGKVQEYNKSK